MEISSSQEKLRAWLELQPGVEFLVESKNGCSLRLSAAEESAASSLLRRMILEGFDVVDFHRRTRKLEEAFVDAISGPVKL